jgi:hypothetical protein
MIGLRRELRIAASIGAPGEAAFGIEFLGVNPFFTKRWRAVARLGT